MTQKTFAERFLKHLDKIDPAEIESFVRRTVRERDFIARIFETLTEGIVVMDGDCRITMVNAAARRILHLPGRRRLTGEEITRLLSDARLREMVDRFIADPKPVQNEELRLGESPPRIYNVHLLPVAAPGDADSPEAAALILQDLTLTRERQARSAEEQKLASLATLTAGVAHEIKNPLNSLSIHAQLIARAGAEIEETGVLSEKTARRVAQSCRVVGEEVERLRGCVDDFIEAARPHKPHLALNDLNRIVRDVVGMAELEMQAREVDVETGLEPDLPMLLVDPRHIQSALRNLMRNAVEALDAAQRKPGDRLLRIETRAEDETAALSVSDNGCGIRQADMPKIFEPYFTTKFSGSGLGLMAVVRIVREHGGHLSVKSEEGEGTTFTIELPIAARRTKLLEGS